MSAADPAKSLESCLTLCNPIDSPPGCPIPGILQARTLKWVVISFSNAWKRKMKVKSLSRVQLCATQRRQPTRLPHPWDSPGKNTEVGCHFLLQGMKVKRESEVAQSCLTLSDPMDCMWVWGGGLKENTEKILAWSLVHNKCPINIGYNNFCCCCC